MKIDVLIFGVLGGAEEKKVLGLLCRRILPPIQRRDKSFFMHNISNTYSLKAPSVSVHTRIKKEVKEATIFRMTSGGNCRNTCNLRPKTYMG